jgi:hypothetical protein
MQRASEKIQAEYDKAVEVIKKKTENFSDYTANATIETVINLSKQVAPMGAEAAKNYLEAWQKVISDSNLNADTSE